MFDYLIVGAGLAGCVLAERISAVCEQRVLVVDLRDHVGGNCYDYHDEHGILLHAYGPHWFHTNSERVFHYLSRFTTWRHHFHVVQSYVDGQHLPMPVNIDTLNLLYGLRLRTADEMQAYLDSVREPIETPRNAEEQVTGRMGRNLYEKLFRGYTVKQWGRDPAELSPSVTARIPIHLNHDHRYFLDRYQGLPSGGYTRMFRRMLANPGIAVLLKTDFRRALDCVRFKRLIYTGPIDSFFDHRYGPLPYRSVRFEHQTYDVERYQPVQQVNFPDSFDFTRSVEWKHATGQRHPQTTVTREYPAEPTGDHDKFYPVPTEESEEQRRRYRRLADRLRSVIFVGRLADYRYYNMDQIVARALHVFETSVLRGEPALTPVRGGGLVASPHVG
jgi:UDP-galactopyranose mutase